MKHEDAIRILTTWQERMQDCEQRMGELGALIGTSPEAPLQASVYGLMGDYTKAISTRLGCSDEWLEAWWLEHNFGERPMSAGVVGEPMRQIKTIEQLVALIVDDAEVADAEARDD